MERVLEGKRVFVIEDDVTNMAVFTVALKNAGALVMQDFWNSASVALLKQTMPVDVVLLDLMLRHGASGYDIFDQLRAVPELASVPVIVVSASDPEIEIPRAKVKGMTGFIGKPISLQEFPRQVAACLNGEPMWAAAW